MFQVLELKSTLFKIEHGNRFANGIDDAFKIKLN